MFALFSSLSSLPLSCLYGCIYTEMSPTKDVLIHHYSSETRVSHLPATSLEFLFTKAHTNFILTDRSLPFCRLVWPCFVALVHFTSLFPILVIKSGCSATMAAIHSMALFMVYFTPSPKAVLVSNIIFAVFVYLSISAEYFFNEYPIF